MRLDARRSLQDLHEKWGECTACELGVRRKELRGSFVAGEGSTRGIMFIGEGPGRTEERDGRPFVGQSGKLLRKVIAKLNIQNVSYITNIVTCRSCAQDTDAAGQPVFTRVRGIMIPKYKDQPPTPVQIQTCLPRLYEEIYLVDPLLIVSLGATAASSLLNRPVTIMKESGHVDHIDVPGVLQRPVLTDKRNVWVRKNKDGTLHLPTERSVVRYLLIPTLHPAFVVRAGGADYSDSSPLRKFFEHLKLASLDFIKLSEYYGITINDEIDQTAQVEDVWDNNEEDDDASE